MSGNNTEAWRQASMNTAMRGGIQNMFVQTPQGYKPGAPVGKPILEVAHLKKDFPVRGFRLYGPAKAVHAVEDTSLALYSGRATALVGESGSGKTTVARLLARLALGQGAALARPGKLSRRRPCRRHPHLRKTATEFCAHWARCPVLR